MKIERYRPNYFEGFDKESEEISTFDELMDIEWIKQWEDHPKFHRFSINVDKDYKNFLHDKPQHTIMAELKDGYEWWVIAIVREEGIKILTDNLPLWEPKYKKDARKKD